jgi:hypothetical protein
MAIKHIIILFVETPRKFITWCYYIITWCYYNIISTDEDPGLRIESFAVINLRGVSTNKTIIISMYMSNI